MAEIVPTIKDGLIVSSGFPRLGTTYAELIMPTSQVFSAIPNSAGKLRFAYMSAMFMIASDSLAGSGQCTYTVGTGVIYLVSQCTIRAEATYPIHGLQTRWSRPRRGSTWQELDSIYLSTVSLSLKK
jgi:hypothetical protein